jgi:regulator of replication initiation timing
MTVSRTGTVPLEEYEQAKQLNRELLQENTDLKIQISHLQKEIARLKEATLYVN